MSAPGEALTVKYSMENDPKVFGNEDVTIVLNALGGISIFAGQTQIGLVQSISVSAEIGILPKVEVDFPVAVGTDLDLKCEEYVRALVSKLPWVQIRRV